MLVIVFFVVHHRDEVGSGRSCCTYEHRVSVGTDGNAGEHRVEREQDRGLQLACSVSTNTATATTTKTTLVLLLLRLLLPRRPPLQLPPPVLTILAHATTKIATAAGTDAVSDAHAYTRDDVVPAGIF